MSKRWTLCIPVLAALVLCSGTPVRAQRGQGRPPGAGPGQQGAPSNPGRPAAPPSGQQSPGSAKSANSQMKSGSSTNSAGKTTSELLAQNTKLSSKLGALLPAGTNLQEAASGFKNLGQFVAAVHVSKNLGIPFDQLKTKVTSGESLGSAIHDLSPAVNAKTETRKAQKQANQDLRETRS